MTTLGIVLGAGRFEEWTPRCGEPRSLPVFQEKSLAECYNRRMDSAKSGENQEISCASCDQSTPSYKLVSYGSIEHGYKQICLNCLKKEMAEAMGLEVFEHPKFEPVGLPDCTGEVQEFHFRTNLSGPGVTIDAFQLRDGDPSGYQFQIIGNPENDLLVLFGELIQKIRRGLSTKHIVDGPHSLQIADHGVVRRKIECDVDHDGRARICFGSLVCRGLGLPCLDNKSFGSGPNIIERIACNQSQGGARRRCEDLDILGADLLGPPNPIVVDAAHRGQGNFVILANIS